MHAHNDMHATESNSCDHVIYLGGIIWGTKGGTQGNNVIMGWAIVINKVVNPCHVRDHK